MNAVERDGLSSLPNDLIHKIFSFLNITEAIGNSVLSPRWRYIWTSMPYLNFSTEDFTTLREFSKFVTQVLSRRNNQTNVNSMKLSFHGKVNQPFVKRILDYAFSHNIQQLSVVLLHETDIELPLSIFSSECLKHLSLTMRFERYHMSYGDSSTPALTWELPALTTLDLHSVSLCDDEADKCITIITKCANLKNLTLRRFKTKESIALNIFHPRLSNLTLEDGWYSVKLVNVVAPQLKNLVVKFCYVDHIKISAPGLVSFLYYGCYPFHLSTEGFHSLEKAVICVSYPEKANAHQIACLLRHLHNVKFLKLNLEIVEILSSSTDRILRQPSPIVNLKSLNIYPANTGAVWLTQARKKVTMSAKLKRYLLHSSSGCTFTIVLREEYVAQKLLAELEVLLEKEKNDTNTNSAHLDQGKEPAKSRSRKKLKTDTNLAQINSSWENLSVQIKIRTEKARFFTSMLKFIEELLANLPASNRAKIQPRFSSVCVEADIVISKISDDMKIQCDENQSRSSLCFRKLATTLKASS